MGEAAGPTTRVLQLALPSELDAIADAIERFNAFADEHDVPVHVRRAFDIAFDDLLCNVVTYGYAGEAGHVIDVRVELHDDRLVGVIADRGVPFDPFADTAEPDTSLSVEEREIGGLGVHLVRRLMDAVGYVRRDEQNIVSIEKRLGERADGSQ